MQQMAMNNVDVKITQRGLTKVPISEMARLKQIIDDARDKSSQKVAKAKLDSNLRFYQSLNTRPPRSNTMYKRLKQTMVVYSAASKDNRGLSINQLERALASMSKISRNKQVSSKPSEFAQLLESSSERNYVSEFPELTV